MARWAEYVAASLFLTLFPADCRICGSPLLQVSRIPVCQNCLEAPQPLSGSLCGICGEACGATLAGLDPDPGLDPNGLRCRLCQLVPPPFERAVAYSSYDGALRDLIHLLKFGQVRPAERVLGRMLADSITALEPALPPGTIEIVPVPLHAQKQSQRGFNQAEVLGRAAVKHFAQRDHEGPHSSAAGLAERFTVCTGVLVRQRDTGSQVGLTHGQRRRNLRGAFVVKNKTRILNRNILLVDDVYTTGATASECARVLRRAGATRVWVATVARTLRIFNLPVLPGLPQEENQEQPENRPMVAAHG